MKRYELTVMLHPDLEMNPEPALNKVKALIDESGGKITKESNEGKKRLSYPIKDQAFALYYFYELELPPEAPSKLVSVFNITDEVIRYLLVKEDARKLKALARKVARRAGMNDEREGVETRIGGTDNDNTSIENTDADNADANDMDAATEEE